MKKSLQFLGFILLLTVLGCEQIIPIDLPETDPVLVVNAPFTPDSVWQASVSSSQSIQVQDPPKAVTNARILILENGNVIDSLVHSQADVYVSALGTKPVAGHSYTLRASAPGFAETSGADFVPVPVSPQSVAWRDSVGSNNLGDWFGEISFQINDPAATDNFYVLTAYQLDTIIELTDTTIYFYQVNLETQDPIMEYDTYSGALLFGDETFDGTTRAVRVTANQWIRDSGTTFFALSTVSQSYYRYVQTMSAYFATGFNPFAEPVRVHSNMTPGMGIFAGYSTVFAILP